MQVHGNWRVLMIELRWPVLVQYLARGGRLLALQSPLRLGLHVGGAETRAKLALQPRREGGALVAGLVRNDWQVSRWSIGEMRKSVQNA